MGVLNFLTGTLGYTAILGALALAVAAHFFAPRAWSALAWSVAFVLLGAAFVGQREITAGVQVKLAQAESRIDKLVGDYARAESDARRQALEHERAIAAKEQFLTATLEANAKEAQRAQSAIAADRDRARAAEHRLRDQLATLVQRYRADGTPSANPAAAGQQPPAGDAIGVLADVLGRADQRAGELADFADRAHAAGLACERDYDAARAALMEQGLGPWRSE
jgi:hypothetical protein